MKRKTAKKSDIVNSLREAGITNRMMHRVTIKMEFDELEGVQSDTGAILPAVPDYVPSRTVT